MGEMAGHGLKKNKENVSQMAKSKTKEKAEAAKPSKFSEFNPCRANAKGRPAERIFWVEELINAEGRSFKDCHEAAAKAWARAAVKAGVDGVDSIEDGVTLYKNNIPGTRGNTEFMLNYIVEAIQKKFGREFSFEIDDDGEVTVNLGGAAKAKKSSTKKTETPKKSPKVKAKDDDEDEDEESDDEDEEDDDEEDED